MDIMLFFIITLIVINAFLLVFNRVMKYLRTKNVSFDKERNHLKIILNNKIRELQEELENLKVNHINVKEYNELVRKYNLLLDQYRRLLHSNSQMKLRIRDLRAKIY